MEYIVIGSDGNEYGPVAIDELKEWIEEERVGPQTELKDPLSGHKIYASSVTGLFPQIDREREEERIREYADAALPKTLTDDRSVLWAALMRAVLALIFFFILQGIGLIIAGFGLYDAIQAKRHGSKYGNAAVAIISFTLALILAGLYFRVKG